MKKFTAGLIAFILLIGLPVLGFGFDMLDTYVTNKKEFALQKIDDATKYESLKEVENTARVMISSYESDKLTYDQYKDSENEDEKGWASQAKMRANKTASTYNNYILKNEFLWKGNVPSDIRMELWVIQ